MMANILNLNKIPCIKIRTQYIVFHRVLATVPLSSDVFSPVLSMTLQYNLVLFPSGIWIVYMILLHILAKVFVWVFAEQNALILHRHLPLHKFAGPHVELWFTDWT
jgi:hypothetical protein